MRLAAISSRGLKWHRQLRICPQCRMRSSQPLAHQAAQIIRNSRWFSSSSVARSGHSKWATIKHDKARNDGIKSKERVLYAQDITKASRLYGPDPSSNPALAQAIQKAKKNNFPRDSIEAAIARGQGKSLSGEKLEPLIEEALIPPAAIIVDCLTDNRPQTQMDVRKVIKSFGGKPSSTAYMFEKRGRVIFAARDGLDADGVLDAAIEAGALDVYEGDDDMVVVLTEVTELKAVSDAMVQQLGLTVQDSRMIWTPTDTSHVEAKHADQLGQLTAKLKEIPEVQGVYSNAAVL